MAKLHFADAIKYRELIDAIAAIWPTSF